MHLSDLPWENRQNMTFEDFIRDLHERMQRQSAPRALEDAVSYCLYILDYTELCRLEEQNARQQEQAD